MRRDQRRQFYWNKRTHALEKAWERYNSALAGGNLLAAELAGLAILHAVKELLNFVEDTAAADFRQAISDRHTAELRRMTRQLARRTGRRLADG